MDRYHLSRLMTDAEKIARGIDTRRVMYLHIGTFDGDRALERIVRDREYYRVRRVRTRKSK